ncbi:MAG: tetratricopeptide repeat protein [Endomicrobia bacterium]|nr:tetratricopeptide repeat protein [Endomicrobiia bacterium]
MRIKIIFMVLSLSFFSANAFCESYWQQFNALLIKGDFEEQLKLLKEWEKTDAADAELYVAYFNYYVNKSRKEIVRFGNDPKVGALAVTEAGNKEPVAYMYSEISYDPDLMKEGYKKINAGIEKYPERLDMRFGKIYMCGETGDYETFTKEIIDTIEYSGKIQNKWMWTDGKILENPQEFMLSAIQDYQVKLYNTENDDLLENMKLIAETILKYYPEHVESLSNLSLVHSLRKEYDKALELLHSAEKIAPQDVVVLSNIAQIYKITGDIEKSKKYYELAIKYGNENEKKYAREQIESLKNK